MVRTCGCETRRGTLFARNEEKDTGYKDNAAKRTVRATPFLLTTLSTKVTLFYGTSSKRVFLAFQEKFFQKIELPHLLYRGN